MHLLTSFASVFLTLVLLGESSSKCIDQFALRSVDARVHKQRNTKAIVFREKHFSELDEYIFVDVIRANVSQLCEGMIKKFPRLQTLSLININLTLIEPGTFQEVTNLKHLSLAVNQLTTIPRGVFNTIPNLTTIYLTRNQIETIDDGAFSLMPKLKALHLDHNKLTQLSGNILFGSPKISLVDFSYNMITKIAKNSFDDLRPKNIKVLNIFLKKNEIVEIEDDVLKELIPVDLHLESNRISRISPAVFSAKEGSNLYFTNNDVVCVADDVIEWIKVTNIVVDLKSNPVDCQCLKRLEDILKDEFRGELNIESILPCQVNFPFFGNSP